MKMKRNQVESVLGGLRKGSLSASQAQSRYGVKNLRARISDLRERGWQIETNFRVRSGKALAVYTLLPTSTMIEEL